MRSRHDIRLSAIIVTLALVVVLGLIVQWLPLLGVGVGVRADAVSVAEQAKPAQGSKQSSHDSTLLERRFQQASAMLHSQHYQEAASALHEVLQLAPRLPEAHANMGFALLGLGDSKAAADFFQSTLALRKTQVNAYYGLAVAFEQQGDLPAALGAMRSYVHLTQADDPYLPKARAALWEWEAQLQNTDSGHSEQALLDSEE